MESTQHQITPGAELSYQGRLVLFFIGLIFSIVGVAQTFPVDANTVLIPPHSLTLADYQVEKSQDLMVNITLNDPIEPFWDVRFRITVSNNGTEILQTSPSYMPEAYRLNQFTTVMLTGFELSEYLSMNNLVAINGYTKTGTLPEGLNSICIEVLDFHRPDVVLSRKACGSGYAILNDPPFPQLPICEGEVHFQDAQNIVFTWLPMHLGSPNPVGSVQYNFRLVRVEEGYNQYEAMEAAQPIYEETTPNTTIALQDPILEPGFTYAWQVQAVDAMDGTELNSFKNQGYSVVCSFNYTEATVDLTELYEQDLDTECSASCQADIPSNSEIITDLSEGDIVQVGKFYMNVTQLTSASGGFYKGKGYIFIPFLLSNMNVTFEDLTVNTDMVMFSGDVVTDIDSDLLDDNYADTDGEMTVSADEISAINDYVESESRQANQMEYGSSLGLPIALDNTIGGVTNNLIITGISFDKDIAYLNAVMSFGSSSGGDLIAFGAKGICFHPYGIGGGTAELALYEDFSLGDYSDIDLTFKAPGDGNEGTFITFDCTGFQELNIEGEYEFPTDVIVAADGSGEPITATFNLNTTEWGQFIASLEMDPFEVSGVEGYTFTLESAYLDYSDVANPDDISFPEDYEDTEDDWKGFYLSTLSLTLPDDLSQASGDISVGVKDVIIDHSGVSGNVFAADVLQLDDGRLGEWAFSIDTVQINIASNTLTDGNLLGQIHVPILDEGNSLNYDAAMTKTDGGIDLLFSIQTEEDVSVSMWAAEMSLSSASVIAIEKTSDGFTPYAELHGDITLDLEIQEGNSFEIEAMSFEGLKINHPDESKRLTVDAFSLFGGGDGLGSDDDPGDSSEDSDGQESLSGFPVSFSNVSFVEGDDSNAGINFDLNLNLTGDELGIGATGNLTVNGKYNASGAPFNAWSFESVELSSLEVDADLAAGSIQGSLEIYKRDETYGSGFKGLIGAEFKGVGKVDALAQFGKVDGYRYFFVDAMVLGQSPFVDILGVGLYGFGGGMYHHMSRDDSDPAMNLEAGTLFAEPSELGASLSGIVYTPDKSTLLGLKAGLTMGIAPGTSFSADASLEASFGLNNSVPSLRSIAVGGKAYFMSPGTILDREDSQVIGQFDANLDLSDPEDPVFTGTAQVTFDTNIITGSGSAAMKLSSDESYIWIGTPTNPVSIGVKNFGNFQLYADMGDRVPPMPSIRSLVPNYRGSTSNQRPADLGGTKIVFGAKFGIDKQSYSYGSFYASAQFGLGFDAYLSQVSAADCGVANGNIGIDNWYLSGQAYAYGSGNVGIKVNTFFYEGNINILDLSASVVMQAQLPNPTWLKGEVAVDYSVLSGAISGSVDYSFEVGERCQFTTNAMAGVEVIADISPKSNARNVSCLASPTVAFNFGIKKIIEVGELDEDGNKTTYQYRPVISSFTLNNRASYVRKVAKNGITASLTLANLLKGQTEYDCYIAVRWEKRKKGRRSWTKLDGVEEKSFSFRTGDPPEFIPTNAVAYARPFVDGRNIYDRDRNASFDVFLKQTGWSYLFDDPDNYDYQLKIEDLTTSGSKTMDITYSEAKFVSFLPYRYARISGTETSWNTWINGRDGHIFKCTVLGVYKNATSTSTTTSTSQEDSGGAEGNVSVRDRSLSGVNTGDAEDKTIYVWHFRKSDYNTPSAKLRDYKFREAISYDESYEGYNTQRHQVMGYFESSDEMMDKMDYEGISTTISGLDFTLPATFTFQIVDYNSSKRSKIKSIMDRHKAIYRISDDIRDCSCKSYFKNSWRRNRSRFSGYIGDKMSWSMNDVWGTGKGWNRMVRSYNRDYLIDSEKSSGQPVLGVSRSTRRYNGVRFWTRAERWVTHEHKDMRQHGYNNTHKGFRYDHKDYIWKNWNASGRMTDSRWKVKVYNPETGKRATVTVDPK